MRPVMSLALPGANGMIAVMLRVGQLWAAAGTAIGPNVMTPIAAAPSAFTAIPILASPIVLFGRVPPELWHVGQAIVTGTRSRRMRPTSLPECAMARLVGLMRFATLAAALCLAAIDACAQGNTSSIFLYRGPDREERLAAEARKEGA